MDKHSWLWTVQVRVIIVEKKIQHGLGHQTNTKENKKNLFKKTFQNKAENKNLR